MDFNKYSEIARESGFTHCARMDIGTLEFLPEVREMCNEKACGNYNKSWSCPPACPPLEELREKVKSYSFGLLVQTIGDIEDSYDWDGIMEAGKRHKENFGRMHGALEKEHGEVFAMGAGMCSRCEKCTYPDNPCRFPKKMSASMEASGLYVSKVCVDNGLKYNYGQDKIAFTSCYLIK